MYYAWFHQLNNIGPSSTLAGRLSSRLVRRVDSLLNCSCAVCWRRGALCALCDESSLNHQERSPNSVDWDLSRHTHFRRVGFLLSGSCPCVSWPRVIQSMVAFAIGGGAKDENIHALTTQRENGTVPQNNHHRTRARHCKNTATFHECARNVTQNKLHSRNTQNTATLHEYGGRGACASKRCASTSPDNSSAEGGQGVGASAAKAALAGGR